MPPQFYPGSSSCPETYSPTFRSEAFSGALCASEHFPPKEGVETIVKGVGVAGEYLVVGQREFDLKPAMFNFWGLP
jgi:hypothetical protein